MMVCVCRTVGCSNSALCVCELMYMCVGPCNVITQLMHGFKRKWQDEKRYTHIHTNNQGKVTATSALAAAAAALETPFAIRWRKEEFDLRKMCCTYKYAHYLIKGQNVEQIVLQHLARHFWYPRTLWKWLDWHHQKASTDVLQRKWLLSIESSEKQWKKRHKRIASFEQDNLPNEQTNERRGGDNSNSNS